MPPIILIENNYHSLDIIRPTLGSVNQNTVERYQLLLPILSYDCFPLLDIPNKKNSHLQLHTFEHPFILCIPLQTAIYSANSRTSKIVTLLPSKAILVLVASARTLFHRLVCSYRTHNTACPQTGASKLHPNFSFVLP